MKRMMILMAAILLIGSCKKDDPQVSTSTNTAPVSDAGRMQNVIVGTLVTLDGSQSKDADHDKLTFKWTMKSMPVGSTASLSDGTESHPTFTPDMEGNYIVTLIVNDGKVSSKESSVTINSVSQGNNSAPVSHAGHDQNVSIGTVIYLDGTASTDANSHPLTYAWSFVSIPSGSAAQISDLTSSTPSFTADVAGDFVVSLVVNDGFLSSTADQVIISTMGLTERDQLINLGIDPTDADYLLANHAADVTTVLADQNLIFKGMPALDNMFALPTDPDAAPFADNQMTNWTADYKAKFTKMFGRLVFIVNSPKFIQSFNTNIGLLNSAYQGLPPAVPFPNDYAQFKVDANAALLANNYQYKFFVSARQSGFAYGMVGLRLKVEDSMFGVPDPGAPHNAESLIFHELTHTWGYTHASANPADYQLIPNNIPYYVQFIAGLSYIDPALPIAWGTPDALLTVYFGN